MYHIAKITLVKKEVLREIQNGVYFFELPCVAGVLEARPEKIETFLIDWFEKIEDDLKFCFDGFCLGLGIFGCFLVLERVKIDLGLWFCAYFLKFTVSELGHKMSF